MLFPWYDLFFHPVGLIIGFTLFLPLLLLLLFLVFCDLFSEGDILCMILSLLLSITIGLLAQVISSIFIIPAALLFSF